MNIIVRKNLAITIGVIFFILVVLFVVWLCMVITDYVRYKTNSIPIFAYNVSIIDEEEGHTQIYKGLGYKYLDRENGNFKEFYVFGVKI